MKGKRTETDPGFAYLDELKSTNNKECPCTKPEDFLNLSSIEEALKVSLRYKLRRIIKLNLETKATKIDFVNTLYAQDIVEVTQDHIRYITYLFFMKRL